LCGATGFDIIDINGVARMSDLLIRKMPAHMKRQIKERARAHGRSMSEEAQALIQRGLSTSETKNMASWLFSLVPEEARGDDLVFEIDDRPKPAEFE
jgi:plasmid stability protein